VDSFNCLDDESAASELSLCIDGVGCGTTSTDDEGAPPRKKRRLRTRRKRLLVKITVKRITMAKDKMITGRKVKAKGGN